MASQKQLDANRNNARKSTGPKTEEGKTASKFNALKHGLSAATPVLPHENNEEFTRMRQGLIDSLEPVGELEEQMVDHVAYAQWRLVRTERVEMGALNLYVKTLKAEKDLSTEPRHTDDDALTCVFRKLRQSDLANWFRYQNHAERAYYRAIQALHRTQMERLRKQEKMAKLEKTNRPKQEIGFVPQPSSKLVEMPVNHSDQAPSYTPNPLYRRRVSQEPIVPSSNKRPTQQSLRE